jgi:hypothetical protein
MIPASQLPKISAFQLFSFSAFISIALAAWLFAGRSLLSRTELDVPLNIMGINQSPYGEVIALAMQGPIDQTFQGGLTGRVGVSTKKVDPSHLELPATRKKFNLTRLISHLDEASQINTNPKSASTAHRLYLRRQAEDKLRFAYHLDPSQYSNYNSLHFFLTEPALGTRAQLTPTAADLARKTIDYCLKQQHDPRPALTAAAACTNMLHLMFADRSSGSSRHSTEEMREVLATLDQCIARYDKLASQWDDSGNWNLLSPQRIQESLDRYEFILKIRNAADIAISQFSTSQIQPDLID